MESVREDIHSKWNSRKEKGIEREYRRLKGNYKRFKKQSAVSRKE